MDSSHVADLSDQPNDPNALDDLALARQALRDVLADPTTPAAARAQAARTLAEMAGALGRFAEPPKRAAGPLADMTAAELRAELEALEQP